MKDKLLLILISVIIIIFPKVNFGQAPDLGSASGFALFTAAGAFDNVGVTNITGNIGTNVGAVTGFPPGTIVGQFHVVDPVSIQAATDVETAYSYLSGLGGIVLGVSIVNGQILTPGVYNTGAASTLNGDLIIDGQGNSDALFIIRIGGAFATGISSNVILINSASLCNVYWQIGGQFDLGDSSVFRGTIIADGAINFSEGSSLIGRGLSRGGAISLHNNIVTIGIQPTASIISASGTTTISTGDSVILSGNNGGIWGNAEATPSIIVKTSGDYFVTNKTCCDSVTSNHIIVTVSALPIELLNFTAIPVGMMVQLEWSTASETNNDYYTVQSSKDGLSFIEVIRMDGAGNSNTVLYYSALDYHPIDGTSYYRLKQTDFDGQLSYSNLLVVDIVNKQADGFNIYPNPFNAFTTIKMNDGSNIIKTELRIYDILGADVINTILTNQITTLETNNLPSGIYFYKVIQNDKIIQTGKLISQ